MNAVPWDPPPGRLAGLWWWCHSSAQARPLQPPHSLTGAHIDSLPSITTQSPVHNPDNCHTCHHEDLLRYFISKILVFSLPPSAIIIVYWGGAAARLSFARPGDDQGRFWGCSIPQGALLLAEQRRSKSPHWVWYHFNCFPPKVIYINAGNLLPVPQSCQAYDPCETTAVPYLVESLDGADLMQVCIHLPPPYVTIVGGLTLFARVAPLLLQ